MTRWSELLELDPALVSMPPQPTPKEGATSDEEEILNLQYSSWMKLGLADWAGRNEDH